MARIRTIKPEFFKHYDLWEAEHESGLPLRLAFAGLWTIADREGRFHWKPPQLKIEALPYDDVDFSRVLDALATRGFIVRYRVNGRDYGYIPSWHSHQVVNNRERASELPKPPDDAGSTRDARVDDASARREVHAQAEGKGREGNKEGKGRDGGRASARGQQTEYAFVGHIIRLKQSDLDQWRETYHAVPDMLATLRSADAYYADNPPKNGKWFFPVSKWLEREHKQELERRGDVISPELQRLFDSCDY